MPTQTASRKVKNIDFTPRQFEVLRLLAEGLTLAEIGKTLSIAPRTVKAHIDAMKVKLGITSARKIPMAYYDQTGIDPWPRRKDS